MASNNPPIGIEWPILTDRGWIRVWAETLADAKQKAISDGYAPVESGTIPPIGTRSTCRVCGEEIAWSKLRDRWIHDGLRDHDAVPIDPAERQEKCPDCDGLGEYSLPEASSADGSDGWYKCERCKGTGKGIGHTYVKQAEPSPWAKVRETLEPLSRLSGNCYVTPGMVKSAKKMIAILDQLEQEYRSMKGFLEVLRKEVDQ